MTQNEDLKIEVSEQDIRNATTCVMACGLTSKLKPSEIASPITVAFLRMQPDSFLFTFDGEIAVLQDPEADVYSKSTRSGKPLWSKL
jgi:hypothetical protein